MKRVEDGGILIRISMPIIWHLVEKRNRRIGKENLKERKERRKEKEKQLKEGKRDVK